MERAWSRAGLIAMLGLGLATPPGTVRSQEDPPPQEQKNEGEADRKAQAEMEYQTGMRHLQDNDLPRAREAFERAKALGHPEAEQRLAAVAERMKSGGAPDILKGIVEMEQAKLQEAVAAIRQGLAEADDHNRKGQYDLAIQGYQRVQDLVRLLPPGVPEREEWMARASRGLEESRVAQRQAQANAAEARERMIRQQIEQEEADKRRAEELRIKSHLQEAEDAYKREQYERAMDLARRILENDPFHPRARDLLIKAERRKHDKAIDRINKQSQTELDKYEEFVRETKVVMDPRAPVRFPDDWQAVRLMRERQDQSRIWDEPPWMRALREKLRGRQLKSPLRFQNRPLKGEDGLLGMLEEQADIHIYVSRTIEDQVGGEENLRVTFNSPPGRTIEDILNELTETNGWKWTLRNGAVFIGTPQETKGSPVPHAWSVKDLLPKPNDFRGPSIGFGQMGQGGSPLTPEPEEEEEEVITGEELIELLRDHIGELQEAENRIQYVEQTGQMLISAPPEVHRQVERLLENLRGHRQLLVTLQAKFILVSNDVIDDLGVSWNGLSGRTILGQGTGIVNAPGGNTDIRFGGPMIAAPNDSSPQNLGAYPVLDASFFKFGGQNSAISNAPSFLSYTFLNDMNVSALVRMLHATGRGTIVHSPILTCLNTQRAHMLVLNDRSYINGVGGQVGAQGAALVQPQVGVIRSGVVFDVRPIVSSDRKFITMELRPTLSEVVRFRELDVQAAAVQGQANQSGTVRLELPEITLRQVRTTVSVPDNGSILIGGLSRFNESSQYTGLPFVSKMPVLKFFFGRHADVREHQSLLILVRAQVVDNQEEEEKLTGTR